MREVKKLTAAPTIEKIAVFTKSAGLRLVKKLTKVPPIVPTFVPLSIV